MSAAADTSVVLERWLEGGAEQLPGTGLPWLDSVRRSALGRMRDQGVPTSKQEGWRYTSLKALIEQPFRRYAEPVTGVQEEDVSDVAVPGLEAHRVVLVNGRYAPHLSRLERLPRGVRAGGLRKMLSADPDAVAGRLNEVAGEGAHVFSALNTAGLDDGFVLLIDGDRVVDEPIEIIHLSVGMDEPRVAQPRHLVVLEPGARARLIERYVSLGKSLYCTNALVELSLGRGSSLVHHRVQLESPNAFHLSGLYLSQAAESRYRGVNIGLGAAWSRNDLRVRFDGENAECDLSGLYLVGDKQVMDYHLEVEHRVPHCTSRESFKGILSGQGRAVFDGRVFVAPDAQKTDAHLSNKNLLLSRSAEVDTKPQLEIHADDVKCSHGTTVGQIDPEMLFYLRSRGISAPLARRILCLGFAGEIIDALGSGALRDYVADEVGRRLESAPLTKDAPPRADSGSGTESRGAGCRVM